MTSTLERYLTVIALAASLGAASMAGLLFAFSNVVMRALGQMPASSAMDAMQRINVVILNPLFLAIFMGTPVLYLAIAAGAWTSPRDAGRLWLIAGAIAYLVGVLGTTMFVNVPMNDALAAAPAATASAQWPAYLAAWTRWNHVRTAFGFVAAAATLWGAYLRAVVGG